MKRLLALLTILTLLITLLCACGKDEDDRAAVKTWTRHFHVVQELDDDGWLYTFQYIEYDNEENFYTCDKYSFFRVNIRYLDVFQKNAPEDSEAYERDRHIIEDSILNENDRPEDILALDPNDFEFEYLDKERVFDMIREGLTNEAEPDTYDQYNLDRSNRGFFTESSVVDGYEFQVAYISGSCGVDAFYIDVLYQNEEGGYTQLSDMVDDNAATDEQKRAFEEFGKIIESCQSANSYIIDEAYQNTVIGGIDFARLYTMLYDLHTNNYNALDEHRPNTTPVQLN